MGGKRECAAIYRIITGVNSPAILCGFSFDMGVGGSAEDVCPAFLRLPGDF